MYNYRNDTWTFRTDGVPPAAVTTLQASGACNAVNLTWTAPGDDGSTGTAALYDLRGSTVPITAASFSTSPQIASFAPTGAAGTSETFTHNVENCSPVYYYAVKTRDQAGNWSSISNIASASSTCNCGGGGGGGGCPFVYVPTAHGWSVENSILGRSRDGGWVRDVYRIKAPMTAEDGVYRVQIREDEQEVTTLERIQLVAVDHDPRLRAFEVDGQWMVGRLVPPQRVRTGSGIDVTSRFAPGEAQGFRGQPGDALTFEFPAVAPGPRLGQIFELEPLEKLAASDSTPGYWIEPESESKSKSLPGGGTPSRSDIRASSGTKWPSRRRSPEGIGCRS